MVTPHRSHPVDPMRSWILENVNAVVNLFTTVQEPHSATYLRLGGPIIPFKVVTVTGRWKQIRISVSFPLRKHRIEVVDLHTGSSSSRDMLHRIRTSIVKIS